MMPGVVGRRILELAKRHEDALWWLHSAYALLFGVFVMWLGSRDFTYLRIIIFPIAFIWVSSLFLPALSGIRRLSPQWQERIRLAVNYFNKSFYQQLLFFVLPIYYSSATFGSRNMLFVGLLALSAVLATADVVYDRFLSLRWRLNAVFFAFSLFACINVMLPVLWGIGNYWALWVSAVLALAALVSLLCRHPGFRGRARWTTVAPVALALLAAIMILRPCIPPAPLSLVRAEFGEGVSQLEVVSPMTNLPPRPVQKLAALTAIHAPLGLREKVRHRWYLDGRLIYSSPFYPVTGGRRQGYRVWTQVTWREEFNTGVLTLDVETRGGQLIGRATLRKTRGI